MFDGNVWRLDVAINNLHGVFTKSFSVLDPQGFEVCSQSIDKVLI